MPLFDLPINRPQSVMLARDPEVLQTLLNFYAPSNAKIIDVTANSRKMWKGVQTKRKPIFLDIDPEQFPDRVADFRKIPAYDNRFDVVVFDPPHLPVASASEKSHKSFVKQYGLKQSIKGSNISEYFPDFLSEAYRILKPEGLIFAKLKDFVHNHQYQWTLADFISAVRNQQGLTPCDLIIKRDPCGGNLSSSKWKNMHHARNCHCWWVVVRKGGCERKKPHETN